MNIYSNSKWYTESGLKTESSASLTGLSTSRAEGEKSLHPYSKTPLPEASIRVPSSGEDS